MNLAFVHILFTLLFSPLLFGLINRTKAFFAGRKGPSLFQPYFDLYKLLHKSAVFSSTATYLFRLGPLFALAAPLIATLLVPFDNKEALYSFPGDILLFVALFGLARFFMILASLDVGSSFEGMGASREASFSVLIEPALLLAFLALGKGSGSFSLSSIYSSIGSHTLIESGSLALFLAAISLLILFLFENKRIPFDDPNTHLELTMIHEVMILDHSGVDLALLNYGAMIRMWILGSLVIGLIIPFRWDLGWANPLFFLGEMVFLAALIGIIESIMARLKLCKIPELILGAMVLAILALIIV